MPTDTMVLAQAVIDCDSVASRAVIICSLVAHPVRKGLGRLGASLLRRWAWIAFFHLSVDIML